MRKLLRQKKGQSILEYLVIATVIVIAIAAIRSTLDTNITGLYTNAAAKTGDATTALGTLNVEQ